MSDMPSWSLSTVPCPCGRRAPMPGPRPQDTREQIARALEAKRDAAWTAIAADAFDEAAHIARHGGAA